MKDDIYRQLRREALSVLEGEANVTARMATVACLLAHAFPENIWTGFYVVDEDKDEELVVGPYQGTLGCLRIPFARGVCGAAARTGETQVVADVHAFDGHIACDSRSVSEIVVPVRDAEGRLFAVLDIDGPDAGMYGDADRAGLEALVEAVFV
ncbi:GAF domain-containing protein [Parvularcula dongshanensis]|uniref:GAF domain-containing protein n=1 Tax=Parvularcula dongshanensis TaxID=1173995 RepID=A0A840I3X8_9PROT|nr:GAF domain-containing protein [Parvularcula dongshanensis]MBB4658981.1 GAF domain-containing protein [Parvularcula dongshanensis]